VHAGGRGRGGDRVTARAFVLELLAALEQDRPPSGAVLAILWILVAIAAALYYLKAPAC
jgi:hypothetical protein